MLGGRVAFLHRRALHAPTFSDLKICGKYNHEHQILTTLTGCVGLVIIFEEPKHLTVPLAYLMARVLSDRCNVLCCAPMVKRSDVNRRRAFASFVPAAASRVPSTPGVKLLENP